jgi:capsular exopolysaccharide synthesis family protein
MNAGSEGGRNSVEVVPEKGIRTMAKNLDSNDAFLFNLLYVLFNKKYLIVAVSAITFIGVILGTALVTPMWMATAKVQIQMNPRTQLVLFSDLATPAQMDPKVRPANNLIQLLTSRSMAEEIVRLYHRDELLKQRTEQPEEGRDVVKRFVRKILGSPIAVLRLIGLLEEESPPDYFADAVEQFQEDLVDIQLEAETDILTVSVWGESPELATKMANAMIRFLKERLIQIGRSPIEETYNFTKQQFNDVERELNQAQDALRKFKEETNIVQMEEEKRTLIQRQRDLEAALAETKSGLVEKDKRLKEASNQLKQQTQMILSSEVIGNNPLVLEAKSNLRDLEIQLASLRLEKTDLHPDVAALNAGIAEYREKLQNEMERIVQSETKTVNPVYEDLVSQLVSLEIDRIALMGREQALGEELLSIRDELALFPAKEMGLAQLSNLADIKQATYNNLKKKLDELKILKESATSNVNFHVIDDALIYDDVCPDWPKWILNILVGFAGAVVLGLAFAFFIEYWDNSYKTVKAIEEDIGLPVLGSLPYFGKQLADMSALDREPEIRAAYNKLVDALLLGDETQKGKIFLMSSAGPGEGRTTTAVNLAMTLSERGKRTLLVDADLRNPKIASLLNLPWEPGLADAFSEDTSLSDMIRDVSGLSVLLAGRATDLSMVPSDILKSNKLQSFLNGMRQTFDTIIIDSPSIKLYRDALLLSPSADGTLFIVEANRTQKRTILMGENKIEGAGGKIRGIILNKQTSPIPAVVLDLIK